MDPKIIEQIFDELNAECYDNRLLKPEKFFFYSADDSLAKIHFSHTRKRRKLKSAKLGINKRFCTSVKDMKEKVLHEMVHIAVFMDGHISKSRAPFIEHDRYFIKEALRIRREYGYHVPIFSIGFRLKTIFLRFCKK